MRVQASQDVVIVGNIPVSSHNDITQVTQVNSHTAPFSQIPIPPLEFQSSSTELRNTGPYKNTVFLIKSALTVVGLYRLCVLTMCGIEICSPP